MESGRYSRCFSTSLGDSLLKAATETRIYALKGGRSMKRLIALTCLASLAACSGAEEAGEPAVEEEVAVEETVFDPRALATPEESAGTYNVAYPDGSMGTITLAADGTFSFTSGEETSTGTYEMPAPGHYCYTVETGSVTGGCYINGPLAEDGTWTSTSEETGEVATVSTGEG